MRLGGPLLDKVTDPGEWIEALRARGYRAAYCPLGAEADAATVGAFERAAAQAGIVIAEVGAWSNPLSPDEATRRAALEKCRAQLALADEIGARCCVNIAGSRGERWDGPHPDNLTPVTFDLVVETVRSIVDGVHPTRTFYTLEPMPWMVPDSVDSYLDLVRAVDRPRFAVHFDPVNWVCSPQRFYGNAGMISDAVRRLGPYIRSCHAKDTVLSTKLTTHLDEARPGLGSLDYRVYLAELNRLDPDLPLMLEHLSTEEDYRLGAEYIRRVAGEIGVGLG